MLIEIYNFLLSLLLGMLVFVALFIIPVGVVIAIIITLLEGIMDNREQYIQMVHNYEPMLEDLEKYNKSKAKKLRRKWDAMKLHGTDGKQIHLLYNKIYNNLSNEDKKKYIKG